MGVMLTYITKGKGLDRIRITKLREDGNTGNWSIVRENVEHIMNTIEHDIGVLSTLSLSDPLFCFQMTTQEVL